MKTYPLLIGLLGAWSYGLMAPSLTQTNISKKTAVQKVIQYERDAQNLDQRTQGKKAPKYKLVQR